MYVLTCCLKTTYADGAILPPNLSRVKWKSLIRFCEASDNCVVSFSFHFDEAASNFLVIRARVCYYYYYYYYYFKKKVWMEFERKKGVTLSMFSNSLVI
jgi:hypothetical protein